MIDISKIDFNKLNGLIPAVILDNDSGSVLMLGFMNSEALETTLNTKKVTFFSRSKNRLWVKGESSGNFLDVVSILSDCDNDTVLIRAIPAGPTCHNGTFSCFADEDVTNIAFLKSLSNLIIQRKKELPENSYTTKLFKTGSDRIIQKVGEEAIEVVIAAKNKDREEIKNETADLFFHLLVMLADQDILVDEVVETLIQRHKK